MQSTISNIKMYVVEMIMTLYIMPFLRLVRGKVRLLHVVDYQSLTGHDVDDDATQHSCFFLSCFLLARQAIPF